MAFSCSGELSTQRSGRKSSASDPKMDSSRCRTHAFISPTIVPAGMCTSQMTAPVPRYYAFEDKAHSGVDAYCLVDDC